MKNISRAAPLEIGGIPACATYTYTRRVHVRVGTISVWRTIGAGGGQPQALRVVPAARVTPQPLCFKINTPRAAAGPRPRFSLSRADVFETRKR